MKLWGMQNIKCQKCGNKAVTQVETTVNYEIRTFEKLCGKCLYWSAEIILYNNSKEKILINNYL